MTDAELLEEVIVTPRRAFPRLPDLEVIERPGWLQIVTPSITSGGMNEVIYARLEAETADAAIDAAVATYRERGLKFRWAVAPGSAPADLGERLARRGLVPSWGRGMARSTDAVASVARPELAVTEVDSGSLSMYTAVMAAGWSADPVGLHALHEHLLADGRPRLFLASSEGVPAAAASYIPFARSAFLMGAVVLPTHRGRGLYRALVQARLVHARAAGIGLATTHASEATSAPILAQLGFATVCRFQMFFG